MSTITMQPLPAADDPASAPRSSATSAYVAVTCLYLAILGSGALQWSTLLLHSYAPAALVPPAVWASRHTEVPGTGGQVSTIRDRHGSPMTAFASGPAAAEPGPPEGLDQACIRDLTRVDDGEVPR